MTRCKVLAALLAGVAVEALVASVVREKDGKAPDDFGPGLTDAVAEALVAKAAGQAAVVAGEQPTVEFGVVTADDESWLEGHRISFRGPEDIGGRA